jgi:hypothetical protein
VSTIYDVARISVRTLPPVSSDKWLYLVEIIDSSGTGSCTTNKVTMDKRYYLERGKSGLMPEEFVKKSFEFVLEKKELDRVELRDEFDISEIECMYSDYLVYMEGRMHW